MLQVIIADNQIIFRTGISKVLAAEPDIKIVAQCGDVDRLLDSVGSLRHALVVFPCSMTPDLSRVLDRVEHAASRAIVILEHGMSLDVTLAPRFHGVLLRSVAPAQLVDCIRRVSTGERSVQRATVKAAPTPDKVGARVLERLTPKELQIVALLAEGCKNREIAEQLGTKEQVVKNYLRSIYDKTGVSDRLELALFTIHHRALAEAVDRARHGIVRPIPTLVPAQR